MDKKKTKKYSKLALKKGTEAGKKAIRKRLIITGIILLVIIVGIITTIRLIGLAVQEDPVVHIVPPPPDPVVDPPPAPTLQAISPNPDTDGDITLQWSSVSSATVYAVFIKPSGGTWSKIKTTSAIGYTYAAGLSSGTYYFSVKAGNEAGLGSRSGAKSVVVDNPDPTPPPVPVIPTNPSIVINDDNDITNSLEVTLTLGCDNANTMRFKTSVDGTWSSYEVFKTTKSFHLSDAYEDSVYIVFVQFRNDDGKTGEDDISDYITYEVDETLLPANPSIIINDDAEITKLLEITLTLSCDDAIEMCFKLVGETGWTDWTDWEPYNLVRNITLIENSTIAPNHVVKVKFQNDYGESEITFDYIYFSESGEMPSPEIPVDQIIIVIVVTIAFIGAVILILQYSKKMKIKKKKPN